MRNESVIRCHRDDSICRPSLEFTSTKFNPQEANRVFTWLHDAWSKNLMLDYKPTTPQSHNDFIIISTELQLVLVQVWPLPLSVSDSLLECEHHQAVKVDWWPDQFSQVHCDDVLCPWQPLSSHLDTCWQPALKLFYVFMDLSDFMLYS